MDRRMDRQVDRVLQPSFSGTEIFWPADFGRPETQVEAQRRQNFFSHGS